MKIHMRRINSIKPYTRANDPSIIVDFDIYDFDELIGSFCDQVGDEYVLNWVEKNIITEVV